MTAQMAEYKSRHIHQWLDMADNGTLALPDFQRSWVWNPARTAQYLMAVMKNRPTGTFLILESAREPQFGSRRFNGMSTQTGRAKELVLDGQQRLTSLWKALGGEANPRHRFYLQVPDLATLDLNVAGVTFYSPGTGFGRRLEDPRFAYDNKCVPIDILFDRKAQLDKETGTELGEIWHWCHTAQGNGGSRDVALLDKAIRTHLREELLFNRHLWYCNLYKSTKTSVAVDIFVETNSSSVQIKRFDIVVALARGKYGEDLREKVHDSVRSSDLMEHYFKPDSEEWIPDVGEWMLRVACLKSGRAPKESNYEDAFESMIVNDGLAGLDDLLKDLEATLRIAARQGSPTMRTLPSWPPLHVIAAIQGKANGLRDPLKINQQDKLMSAYYWRSLVTNRHEAQANDRLLGDYTDLCRCIAEISEHGRVVGLLPEVFNEDVHPVPGTDQLVESLPWIGSGRLGRAVAALVSRRGPLDWATGQKFDAERIRELEDKRRLDRHHVFPRDILKREGIDRTRIQHGLNGVLLSRFTNRRLAKSDPRDYFDDILEGGVSEDDLRDRVESHLVPYDAMWTKGTIEKRYSQYIKARAKRVSSEIKKVTARP